MFERNRPLRARGSRPWSLILYLNIYSYWMWRPRARLWWTAWAAVWAVVISLVLDCPASTIRRPSNWASDQMTSGSDVGPASMP